MAGVAEGRGLDPDEGPRADRPGPLPRRRGARRGAGRPARPTATRSTPRSRKAARATTSLLLYVARYAKSAGRPGRLPHPAQDGRRAGPRHRRDPARPQRPRPAGPAAVAMGSDTVCAALRAARRRRRRSRRSCSASTAPAAPPSPPTPSGARSCWPARPASRSSSSMGDVAASGGYYVAMAADEIVAAARHAHRLDRRVRRQGRHRRAAGASSGVRRAVGERRATPACSPPTNDFTETQWERVNAWLDRVYDDFVEQGGRGPRPVPRARPRAGQGPGLDRRRRARARSRRRARRS